MRALFFVVLLALGAPLFATETEDISVSRYEGSFDDATFAVENAIINQGLVIQSVNHVGEMLSRTSDDVGSDQELFEAADIFLFCSAKLSRQVMEADPMNIAYCPYSIFVTEAETGVFIGHRNYPDGPMDAVEELLKTIVADAVDD